MEKNNVRTIAWSGIGTPSLDYCCVRHEKDGWRFSGMLVAKLQGTLIGASYQALVDNKFETRKLLVEKMEAGIVTRTKVEFRERDYWLVDGRRRPELDACTDIDIEASPVTNTFPIRRKKLRIGETTEISAAWVRFPSLFVVPLEQSYHRIGPNKYVYRSASGFTAELEIDDFGLVTRYGDIWAQVT